MIEMPQQCTADTGTVVVTAGQSHFRCQLPAGHSGEHIVRNERVEAAWIQDGDTRIVSSMRTR